MGVQWRSVSVLLVLGLLLAACGGDGADPAEEEGATEDEALEVEEEEVPADEAADDAEDEEADADAAGEGGFTIAFMMPDTAAARWEGKDRPLFEEAVAELCPDCEVTGSNADNDASQQQQQVESVLAAGADVLVMTAVDGVAASAAVEEASRQGVPVVAYDRMIESPDIEYYVYFGSTEIGQLQGSSLVARMEELGVEEGSQIVTINGSPTDSNSPFYKGGAYEEIEASQYEIAMEYDTPDWSPDQAQEQMEQAITALGAENIAGVLSANDGMAGGAIAAMKGAGMDPLPPITGLDAELAAVQRIVAGEQYMTVYTPLQDQAGAAAELALALAHGEEPPEGLINGEVENEYGPVPSVVLEPVAATVDNVADTIVADGFWSVEEICTDEYRDACEAAGLQ